LLENVKDIAETAALICAGVYFSYRARVGYFRINLSLSVGSSRGRRSETEDYLVVSVKLTKGPNGSLTLHDAQARVSWAGGGRCLTFPGIARSSFDTTSVPHARKQAAWDRVSAESPFLKIVPGEETELAVHCEVPRNEVCSIEVVVLGQQTNRKPIGQWKASHVSLPRAA
jgi:hypothetical protein